MGRSWPFILVGEGSRINVVVVGGRGILFEFNQKINVMCFDTIEINLLFNHSQSSHLNKVRDS